MVALGLELLGFSTWAESEAEVEGAPEGVLDWDPPYKRFAPWADWRTIRANLAHIANGETPYYTVNIGHEPADPPADPRRDWRVFLPRSRAEAVAFLDNLKAAPDLRRVRPSITDLVRNRGPSARHCGGS